MREPLRKLFGSAWPTPSLWIVAVELDSGRRVVSAGPAFPPPTSPTQFPRAAPSLPISCRSRSPAVVTSMAATFVERRRRRRRKLDLVIVSSPMSSAACAAKGSMYLCGTSPHWPSLGKWPCCGDSTTVVTFEPNAGDQDVMAGNPLDPAKGAGVPTGARDDDRSPPPR
jgi:hypothetical protein